MKEQFKENVNSQILIELVDERGEDQFGRKFIRTHWEKLIQPLNLGSYAKPLRLDIRSIKIENPDAQKDNNIFAGLFKK